MINSNDFNMYYGNTFLSSLHQGVVKIYHLHESGEHSICETHKGRTFTIPLEELSVFIPSLGFFDVSGDLVFIQRIPERTVKKSLSQLSVESFFIQNEELRYMGKPQREVSSQLLSLLNKKRVFNRLSDGIADGATFSILHQNFALAYKGYTDAPVLFYRDTPVGEWVEGSIVPYEGFEIVVDKFSIEFGGV